MLTEQRFPKNVISLIAIALNLLCSVSRSDDVAKPVQKVEFATLDLNHDKVLSLDEFLKQVPEKDRSTQTTFFYEHDTDADSWLTAEELTVEKPQLKPGSPYSRYLKADLNQNFTIEIDEFQKLYPEENQELAEKEFHDRDWDQNQSLALAEFLFTSRATLAPQVRFRRLDVNRDESLIRKEFLSQYEPELQQRNFLNFYRYDLDDNRLLSLKEYQANGDGGTVSLLDKYRARDLDEDDSLTHKEYYTPNIGGKWEKAARDQAVKFDIDQDGKLSLIEFSLTPQGEFPSRELFPELDANKDGQLSLAEFLSMRPKADWRGYVGTFFKADTDQDQQLSLNEFLVPAVGVSEKSLAAYAKHLPPEVAFDLLDKNHDQKIEYKEVAISSTENFSSDLMALIAMRERLFMLKFSFEELDKNEDEKLSREEFIVNASPLIVAAKGLTKDLVLTSSAKWKARDLNEDGRLATEEYVRPYLGGKWEKTATQQTTQFDFDNDGVLSLMEFSLTPQGVFPSRELFPLLDVNQDGGLSLTEFLKLRPPAQWGAYRSTFSAVDSDQNESLTLTEFMVPGVANFTAIDAKMTPSLPANLQFAMFDKNNDGQLQFDELLLPERKDLKDYSSKIWWRERQFGIQELAQQLDTDDDSALSMKELGSSRIILFGTLQGEDHKIRLNATAKFRARDMNDDQLLSPFEYACTNLGTKWEAAAKSQSVLYDLNQDGSLSLLEYAVTPQGQFPSPELFPLIDVNVDAAIDVAEFLRIRPRTEWDYFGGAFGMYDLNSDRELSLPEFAHPGLAKPDKSGRFSLAQLSPQLLFTLLDQSLDQSLSLEELYLKPKPALSDPQSLIRWEEQSMKIEEVFLASDRDQNLHLSAGEFRKSYQDLAAAMLGKSKGSLRADFAKSPEDEKLPWRFIGLVAVNVLLLGGFLIMLLKSVVRSA